MYQVGKAYSFCVLENGWAKISSGRDTARPAQRAGDPARKLFLGSTPPANTDLESGGALVPQSVRTSRSNSRRRNGGRGSRGFTLVELLIVLAIIMTISAMAVPSLQAAIDDARIAKAVGDIRTMETEIEQYEITNGKLPNTLADIGRDTWLDPWGSPYQYLNFALTKGKGKMRKDRFLVPLNTDYDLYSMGKDGQSRPPLTAKVSQDDILRANDGAFLGLASTY